MNNKWKYWLTRILSAVFFYVGWLLCLEEAAAGHPYVGPLYVACMFAFQLSFTKQWMPDIILVLTALVVGTVIDSLYAITGLLSFASPYPYFPYIAPLWIASVWVLYAMCLNHSLVWLQDRYKLAVVLGAAGAYFSYLAGQKLGAAIFNVEQWKVLLVVSLVWAIVTPLSLWYTKKVNTWWNG